MTLHHELRAAAGNSSGPTDPYFNNVSLLLHGDGTNGAQNNTFNALSSAVPSPTAIINAKIYSTYGGGTRSSNYSVEYSDDGVTWTTAFSGVASSADGCGLITNSGGGGSYGTHKYWRYVVGATIVGHHPRVSRIILSTTTTDYDLAVFVADNCADSGTIPATGTTYSNNFTITRYGNTTQGSLSPYGTAWSNYFDGSGDYLSVPSATALDISTGDFTIEAWVYLNAMPTTDTLSDWQNWMVVYERGNASAADGWQFQLGATQIMFSDSYGTAVCQGTHGMTIGSWYHIAVTRNGTTFRVFVNGVQKGTSTSSITLNSGNTYWVGTETGQGAYLNGYLSNLRIVKGTALYTSNFTPSTTPLTAVSGTSLLTCQSNRFIDNSSNNFTLTVNGNTSVQSFSPYLPTAAYDPAVNGGSGYFDGTTDFVYAANSSAFDFGANNLTIECWFYWMGDSSVINGLFGKSGTGSAAIKFEGSTSNSWRVYCGGVGWPAITISGSYIQQNQWTHFAIVRNGALLSVYVNGVSVGSVNCGTNVITSSGDPFVIGATTIDTGWAYYYDWQGYISNFRVVKGTAVYTGAFTPPTAPLTAITNTSLLCNFTNAGIYDNAAKNDLETVGNAQVSTSVKKYGTGSMYFDGTGDYLYTPWKPNLEFGSGNFTVEFWVYISGGNSLYCWSSDHHYGMTFNYAGAAGNKVGVWASSNGTTWNIFNADGGGNGISTGTISLNTWTHVALVRNGSSWVLYLNGTSAWTGTSSSTIITRSTDIFRIGGPWPGAGPTDLNGYIDDLRITKGVARYTANFTPPTQAFPNQ